ncbi:hypothetical protein BASA81_017824 [Batrachochytrium salamandrivorans]|nr:hypothetical protein BASA81_017824 [Batrachochytrium salamandrivorans]
MLLKNGLAHSRVWHLVDAKGKILGKLAQRISIALRGKYKPKLPSIRGYGRLRCCDQRKGRCAHRKKDNTEGLHVAQWLPQVVRK